MLTQNFINIIVTAGNSIGAKTNLIDRNGIAHPNNYDAYQFINNKVIGLLKAKTLSELEAGTGVATSAFGFGSGTSDEKTTDITLTLIDDTQFSANTVSQGTADNKIIAMTTYSYSGEESVTITEVGLFVKVDNNQNTVAALLAREVLESPLTINNGDTFTVSMAIG